MAASESRNEGKKMARRVVVTGMGAVTPLGSTVDTFWDNIRKGQCGIKMITKFDTEEFKVKVAGEVEGFDPELYMTKKDVKRNDLFAVYALEPPYRHLRTVALIWKKRMPTGLV